MSAGRSGSATTRRSTRWLRAAQKAWQVAAGAEAPAGDAAVTGTPLPEDTQAVAWLAETYGAEVVCVTLDLGQGKDLQSVRERALSAGALRARAARASQGGFRRTNPGAG